VIVRVSDGSEPLVNRITAVPALSGASDTLVPFTVAATTVGALEVTLNVSGTKPPLT
jgi:hypothetical protein